MHAAYLVSNHPYETTVTASGRYRGQLVLTEPFPICDIDPASLLTFQSLVESEFVGIW